MPFLQKITPRFGTIAIWELNEPARELAKHCMLNQKEQQLFSTFKAEKRQKEFLSTRLLLQNVLSGNLEIVYETPSGKPLLKDSNLNISITHSSNMVAIYLSEKVIGIDIDRIDRNIDKVIPRFATPSEMKWIKNNDQPQLIKMLLWCAKEAIYKCSGIQGIQFNEQIIIDPFDCTSERTFSGSLIHPSGTVKYRLKHHIIQNNVLVYCVQQ